MARRKLRTSNGQSAHSTSGGVSSGYWALIALVRGDKRMIALLHRALAQGRAFRVPSGVVGQAWRNGRVQVTLALFLRREEVEIVPLDDQLARSCGELCGAAWASDFIDASVVIVARERQDLIVTSDPDDIRRLDPATHIVTL